MLLRKLRVLAAAIEATAGTTETLDAGDAAFNVMNATIQNGITVEQRERQGGFAKLQAISGMRVGTATFQTDLQWDGSATEPAWADTFFPACGWVKSGEVYAPVAEPPGTNVKTLTIGVYENGLYKQLYGAMGDFQIVLPTGRRPYINWTFQGVWSNPSDVAIISPTYPTDEVARFAAASTSFNSNSLCLEQLTFNAGNVLTAKECPGNVAGVDYFLVTDRSPTATGNPEAKLVASANHYGNLTAHTQASLTTSIPLGGRNLIITMPAAQVQAAAEGDRNGIQIDDITWQGNYHSSGELTIQFDAA